MQNLLELHVTEASVFEEVVGKEPPVFFTVDFFMHETQATQVGGGEGARGWLDECRALLYT